VERRNCEEFIMSGKTTYFMPDFMKSSKETFFNDEGNCTDR